MSNEAGAGRSISIQLEEIAKGRWSVTAQVQPLGHRTQLESYGDPLSAVHAALSEIRRYATDELERLELP